MAQDLEALTSPACPLDGSVPTDRRPRDGFNLAATAWPRHARRLVRKPHSETASHAPARLSRGAAPQSQRCQFSTVVSSHRQAHTHQRNVTKRKPRHQGKVDLVLDWSVLQHRTTGMKLKLTLYMLNKTFKFWVLDDGSNNPSDDERRSKTDIKYQLKKLVIKKGDLGVGTPGA
ncbi:hypothetical protein CONLIGDRAFT_692397 [Coniochaeta ligniaria NRRL 30616]|uniref:Uncharacterized protein n=1 Tax=Coniochaeta ligniaria NRRL 30616 TaxID=1408157 RepID=A0A1J7J9H7_9PEZI|nr:hypothetical protein CONLIGDRAFT_692397 [Coniochaeta ligniaria NRRL 30616]